MGRQEKESPGFGWCFFFFPPQFAFVFSERGEGYLVELNFKTCFRMSREWLPGTKNCLNVYQIILSKR